MRHLEQQEKNKIRNSFANNKSTDIKLSKAQISRIIKSGIFTGFSIGKLGKEVVTYLAIPFAKNTLPGLVSNIASNAIINFERRLTGNGVIRAAKGFIFLFLMKIWMM